MSAVFECKSVPSLFFPFKFIHPKAGTTREEEEKWDIPERKKETETQKRCLTSASLNFQVTVSNYGRNPKLLTVHICTNKLVPWRAPNLSLQLRSNQRLLGIAGKPKKTNHNRVSERVLFSAGRSSHLAVIQVGSIARRVTVPAVRTSGIIAPIFVSLKSFEHEKKKERKKKKKNDEHDALNNFHHSNLELTMFPFQSRQWESYSHSTLQIGSARGFCNSASRFPSNSSAKLPLLQGRPTTTALTQTKIWAKTSKQASNLQALPFSIELR